MKKSKNQRAYNYLLNGGKGKKERFEETALENGRKKKKKEPKRRRFLYILGRREDERRFCPLHRSNSIGHYPIIEGKGRGKALVCEEGKKKERWYYSRYE